jgi:predicted GH43/DUF377 family glycosyl hydrolase
MTFMLKWKKLGKIFDPTQVKGHSWMHEFAQCTSTLVFDDLVRVYFSCRPPKDANGFFVSYTTFADFDRRNLSKLIRVGEKPILELGELGTFDEFGIYPTCVIRYKGLIYLYYAGWTRLSSIFADVAIGVAVSKDGEVFERIGKGPILTRNLQEPFQASGPKVRLFEDKLYMYYIGGECWVLNEHGKSESIYKIRLATSENGIDWNRNGQNIINPILEADECQAGPDVFYYQEKYHMYFSYRYGLNFRNNNRGYRIGYAYSHDLLCWHRVDQDGGIGLSETGWDSQDMHYPHAFELDGKWYMLYNGNEFGRYGFGLAELIT